MAQHKGKESSYKDNTILRNYMKLKRTFSKTDGRRSSCVNIISEVCQTLVWMGMCGVYREELWLQVRRRNGWNLGFSTMRLKHEGHRGIGWRGGWQGGSGWGIHVYPWLIHVNIWQKPLKKKKKESFSLLSSTFLSTKWKGDFTPLKTTFKIYYNTIPLTIYLKALCCPDNFGVLACDG